MTAIIPVTLTTAAAAALINLWLAIRIGAVRRAEKISVGDGGNDLLARRMRAQLNYVENTAFVLFLVAAIELSGHGFPWLSWVAMAYLLSRLLHAVGMDGQMQWGRTVGTAVTMLTLLGLAGYAMGLGIGLF
ncbi:MAPEG family protein [Qipengyuania sp. JC766]|uniref:MAPEG family protein n=1 Tax=Qipengyuania sp. JC766 TaxID=3232139 RepID=UPI00345A5929